MTLRRISNDCSCLFIGMSLGFWLSALHGDGWFAAQLTTAILALIAWPVIPVLESYYAKA